MVNEAEIIVVQVKAPLNFLMAVAHEILPLSLIQIRTSEVERYVRENPDKIIPGVEIHRSSLKVVTP